MVEHRLHVVTKRIHDACRRVGRDPAGIELVLVTKAVDPGRIELAYQLGVRDFGENRAQELVAKQEYLPQDIRWHFIGHLQTNKVKFLIGQVSLIHSCDRLDLAKELHKQAKKKDLVVNVLIQINASCEKTKYGFSPEEGEQIISEIAAFDRLNVCGLMTIGPHTQDQERIRNSFRSLRVLRDRLREQFPKLAWRYLSMGMSSDFELAIEEGANLLRIGTAVFGERPKAYEKTE